MTKGGEVKHDKERKGINKKLKHTSRGSKLINLYGAFNCALQMVACISFSFFSNTLLVWCILVVGLNDEMKN
jgi:hypothetical protein